MMRLLINIEFAHSPAWIIPCVLLGILAAVFLYSSKRHFPELSNWKRWLMAILRGTAISLILLLLLNPLIKQLKTQVERRQVVILQDQSQSIAEASDSEQLISFDKALTQLLGHVSVEADTHRLYFSDVVNNAKSKDYEGKLTNISDALEYVWEHFESDHLGAVILASDGLYNEGSNPVYTSGPLEVPLHVIALGDTTANKDIEIKRIFHNRVVYKGDEFEVEADIAATAFKNTNKTVVLSKKEAGGYKKLDTRALRVDRDDFFSTLKFQLPADQSGVITYRISIPSDPAELNKSNNYRVFTVEVLEARQKILILAAGVHPDVEAMRSLLTGLKTFDVDVAYTQSFDGSLRDYNLVILHDLPEKDGSQLYLDRIKQSRLPVLYVLGDRFNRRKFAQNDDILRLSGAQKQFNEVLAEIEPTFNLFTLDDELTKFLPTLPPLRSPFGEYVLNPRYQVLCKQNIKGINTNYPLIAMGESNGRKRGLIAGTGIWRWKMFDYLQNENFDRTGQLLSKMVNYLAVQDDRRRFRTYNAKRIYNENEEIKLNAELYNASYELVNEPEVELQLTDENGDRSTFVFSRTQRAYDLNLGLLPPGDYRYSASVNQAGKRFDAGGSFSIQPLELETSRLRADHGLLRSLTEKHDGDLFYQDQLEVLQANILASDRLKPLYISDQRRSSILNLPYLLGLLLLILCLEWFLRKFFGSY